MDAAQTKAKRKVCLFTTVRPLSFFFFIILVVIPREFPVWPYDHHIKTSNKMKTFSNLPTLFNVSMHYRAQPSRRFGRNSLPKLADFSLFWAEGEVKMYRTYREIQNLDQNFSLSLKSWKCCKTSPCLKALGWPLCNSKHTFFFLGLRFNSTCNGPFLKQWVSIRCLGCFYSILCSYMYEKYIPAWLLRPSLKNSHNITDQAITVTNRL